MISELILSRLKLKLEEIYNIKIESLKIDKFNKKVDIITIFAAGREPKTVWLKTVPELKIQEMFNTLLELHKVFSKYDDIGIIKPVFFISDRFCLENVDNSISLQKVLFNRHFSPLLLLTDISAVRRYIPKCAKWLAVFQNATLQNEPILLSQSSFFKPELIEIDLFRLSQIGLNKRFDILLKKYFHFWLQKINTIEFQKVAYHGDVHFENFLIDKKGRLFATDFENFDFRTPYDDLALFSVYASLRRLKTVFAGNSSLKLMQDIFDAEYTRHTKMKFDPELFRFFKMRYFIHVIGNELILGQKVNVFLKTIYFYTLIKLLKRRISENEDIRKLNFV
jgi:thiamine kinase-like enzyme